MKTRGFFIIALILSLSIQAQTVVTKEQGSVRTTSSSLYKMGKELVVSISIDITRDFSPNESMVLVPVITDSPEHQLELPPIYINSRKQHIIFQRETSKKEKEAQALQRKNGVRQTMHYLQSVPFEKWMNRAALSLIERSCGCGIPGTEDFTCIARLHPQPMPAPQLAFLTPQIEKSKIRKEKGSAFIDFPVNVAVINDKYSNNAAELNKIIETINTIKKDSNVSITHISIHGYASPEGGYANNTRLAKGRTQALVDYVTSYYKFDNKLITSEYTSEDWEGFRKFIAASSLEKKDEILKLMDDSTLDIDKKERQIAQLAGPQTYKYILEECYPALRHSDYTVNYTVRGFNLEETKEIIKTRPQLLSLQEIYRIAKSCQPGSEEFDRSFQVAATMFPDDPIANLNAGAMEIQKGGDLTTAKKHLAKADQKAPETLNNLGVIALLEGDYDAAEKYFNAAKAGGLTTQADTNMKQLKSIRNYPKE